MNADTNVSGRASADGDESGTASEGDAELEGKGEMARVDPSTNASFAATSTSAGDAESPSRVLLGARHDLKLKSGQETASCSCLSVALGSASSGGMSWSALPPALDEGSQLAIALSSEGAPCKGEPKGGLGASYWGYRISGNDVVVLVEAARGGRPLTTGAVIPKPVGSGQVFIAPTSKQLPYGRPLGDAKGLCKIGNPGAARGSGFTELELGVDAPLKATADSSTDTPTTIELPPN